ncbi:MAG: hypothetical protein HYS61_00215 [Acidobacteria bacterium]|nr:hypothetical protein [Acidobacteriota bacterium]
MENPRAWDKRHRRRRVPLAREQNAGGVLVLWSTLCLLATLTWVPRGLLAQTSEPAKSEAEARPQEAAPEESPQRSRKSFPVRNGSVTYQRVEESEKRKTRDGEVEIQRVRMPSWGGTRDVIMEREIRTRKLPDGTVEKEYVLKNPDGADRMAPIEIIRERIKKSGEATTTEREVLKPGYDGRWTPTRKETVSESGPESARQIVKEVFEPTVTGEWKVVDRETTASKSSDDGKESRTVRQLPDSYGRLSDFEVRDERTTTQEGRESRAVSVRRRDLQDTDHPRMFLVERTVTDQVKSADGKVTTKSVTESDLLAGGATRNVTSSSPQIVEETTEVEAPGEGGSGEKVVEVKQRGAVDSSLRPAYQVVQQTDREGNVRQVFIPKAR